MDALDTTDADLPEEETDEFGRPYISFDPSKRPRMPDKKPNGRMLQFCYEYAKTGFSNRVTAYHAAYDRPDKPRAKNADVHAARLIRKYPEIRRYLAYLRAYAEWKWQRQIDRVLTERARVAFARMSDFFKRDADGMLVLDEDGQPIIDIAHSTDDQVAAIDQLEITEHWEGKGENAHKVRRIKIKLLDKGQAQQDLMRFKGLFAKDNEQVRPPGIDLSDDECDTVRKLLAERMEKP